jgi:ribokinase
MSRPIVVVGSINLDLVAGTKRIPVAGETVIGSSFQTFFGGKGANQAVAAARLGASVALIGKLGTDAFGRELQTGLKQAGVDTSAIDVVDESSGVALITTDEKGDNSITVVPGANALLFPADLEKRMELLRSAAILLAQLETPLQTVEYLGNIASKEGIPFVLDPAPARPLPDSLLRNVTWLTPNETETCFLLGHSGQQLSEESFESAAHTLLQRGCRNVILKLGERGCYVALSDGTRKLIPAFKVRAVDTTAAGDAFNGALAVALTAGNKPLEAARWASAVAAVSVTRRGAQPSMPTGAEVSHFLQEITSSQ